LVEELPEGQIPLEWSVEIGPGYSGPTVAEGRVFVMDRQAQGGGERERVLCFDTAKGTVLWEHTYAAPYKGIGYPAGPRASVTIDQGVAFAVGAVGNFHALDAKSGKVLWEHDLRNEYEINMPVWGIAASPLVYENLVIQIVGGAKSACVVAFDRVSGREAWRALNDRPGYSSPILIRQAGRSVLVCWTGDSLTGLDPQTGGTHWSIPFPPSRMPIGIASPVLDGELLYVSSFYDGSLMVRVPRDRLAVEEVWKKMGPDERNTQALHVMIGTPIVRGGFVFGVDSYGEFRCLDGKTGERLWEDRSAVPIERWATIHMVQNEARVWMFNERGELLITDLTPKALKVLDRSRLIEPTEEQLRRRGGVCWSHPAFAEQSIFARNDRRLVRASLRKP
jgi:outer membrane protein assembly factor BamB